MLDGKNYCKQQAPLREKMILIIKERGISPTMAAKEMGVARQSILKFLNGSDMSWMFLVKIEKWCDKSNS